MKRKTFYRKKEDKRRALRNADTKYNALTHI